MKKMMLVAFCVMLTLSAGCGRQPRIEGLSRNSVIVAFGDSLTSGAGANKGESYPAVLAEMLACQVINAGVSGEDTTAGLRRLPAVLDKQQPDLVILCHGGNDMLRKQDHDRTIANLSAMISMVQHMGADIILLAVPRPGLRLKPAPFYADLASKHGIPLNAKSLSEILSTRSLKSDRIHPNADGYRQLATSLYAMIQKIQVGL